MEHHIRTRKKRRRVELHNNKNQEEEEVSGATYKRRQVEHPVSTAKGLDYLRI